MTVNPHARKGQEAAGVQVRIVGGPPPDGLWYCATCRKLVKMVKAATGAMCPVCRNKTIVEEI